MNLNYKYFKLKSNGSRWFLKGIDDLLSEIKSKIRYFIRAQLKDGGTHVDHNAQMELALHLVLRLRGGLQIFVKTLTGKTIGLDEEQSDILTNIRPRFRKRREFHQTNKDSSSLESNSETAKQEPKPMFPTSTLIFGTWTFEYFC